jgi:hypothetical protein
MRNPEWAVAAGSAPPSGSRRPKAGPDRHVTCLLWADTVEKVDFSKCAKFSRGAGAFVRKLYGGTHEQSHFQPAGLVNSLQGIRVPTAVFNGSAARFYRHPPFLVFQQYQTISDLE